MKVSKLIEILEKIKNKEENVEVAISQYNKVGNVAYCQIEETYYGKLQTAWGSHRIEISLPHDNDSFMYTATKKI